MKRSAEAAFETVDEQEPLLMPSSGRFVLFPIQHRQIWEMYKKHEASFWVAEDIDFAPDREHWKQLNAGEQSFLKNVIAFFAASDGIVLENLAQRFLIDVQVAEARAFYGFQIAMENIHAETYSLLIDTFVQDHEEKQRLFGAIEGIPCIRKKAEWAQRWIHASACFAERLVAFAAVEGIFFSASFAAIYWIQQRGILPGLTFSNELISRDETLHCDFACLLFSSLRHRPSMHTVREILHGAAEIESEFVKDSLQVDLIGMNSLLMTQYVRFVTNRLFASLGFGEEAPIYEGATNPFPWMEQLALQGRTNFFEKRVSEYKKPKVLQLSAATTEDFELSEEF